LLGDLGLLKLSLMV
jgi:N-acyl-L-homoserine lactone synthetase